MYEISLTEILSYNRWSTISSELRNNKFKYGSIVYTIQDGYYYLCDLNKYYFAPLKLKLAMASAITLTSI